MQMRLTGRDFDISDSTLVCFATGALRLRSDSHRAQDGPPCSYVPQVLYTLQLKMAQYRARAKAGWEAAAASRAEQNANSTVGNGEGLWSGGVGGTLTAEGTEALRAKEEHNKVIMRHLQSLSHFWGHVVDLIKRPTPPMVSEMDLERTHDVARCV